MLRAAADLGAHYAGASSPVALQNRLYLADAQLAIGDRQQAAVTIDAAHDAALAQYGAGHLLTLRAQLARAQLLAAGGRYEESQPLLRTTVVGLRKLGAQGESVLAQALEALGDGAAHLGLPEVAKGALEEAVTIREKSPSDLWELAEARERLGETLLKQGSIGASALLKQAAHDLEVQLGADHPQTLRARAALTRP